MKKKTTESVLNNICDQCTGSTYCTLKEILLVTQHFDNRVLIQIKCIEIFKYEESEVEGFDIGWTEAGVRWADKGYAKIFDSIYTSDISPRILYQKIKKQIS